MHGDVAFEPAGPPRFAPHGGVQRLTRDARGAVAITDRENPAAAGDPAELAKYAVDLAGQQMLQNVKGRQPIEGVIGKRQRMRRGTHIRPGVGEIDANRMDALFLDPAAKRIVTTPHVQQA